MLPVLGALGRRLENEPVVLFSVHSNKFPAEAEPARIRDAMFRYEVDHPVLVDRDHTMWQSYTVKAWPTIVFVRPDGTIAHGTSGEQDLAALESVAKRLLSEARDEGTLGSRVTVDTTPSLPKRALCYPSGVVATPAGIAIADAGNHRIVLADAGGRAADTIGAGRPGLVDGAAERACFRRPRGLAVDGDSLYVADTGNHALRVIDLATRKVRTIAGSGELATRVPQDLTDASDVELRSPMDVVYHRGVLFIAMAGAHQLWAFLPETSSIAVFAGSGRESLEDGSFHEATFAQPSALAAHDGQLYVADSESSAVRVLDLDTAQVRTLVGHGLFEFGDSDGDRQSARLQHPEGISYGPHGVLVADTYNDKVKALNASTGALTTWFDGRDGKLREPTHLLQLDGGQVVVADTYGHRVSVIDADATVLKPLPLSTTPERGSSP